MSASSFTCEAIEPKSCEYHGRIIKTATAFWLNSPASSTVRCAGEIQRIIADCDLDRSGACAFAAASMLAM